MSTTGIGGIMYIDSPRIKADEAMSDIRDYIRLGKLANGVLGVLDAVALGDRRSQRSGLLDRAGRQYEYMAKSMKATEPRDFFEYPGSFAPSSQFIGPRSTDGDVKEDEPDALSSDQRAWWGRRFEDVAASLLLVRQGNLEEADIELLREEFEAVSLLARREVREASDRSLRHSSWSEERAARHASWRAAR